MSGDFWCQGHARDRFTYGGTGLYTWNSAPGARDNNILAPTSTYGADTFWHVRCAFPDGASSKIYGFKLTQPILN